MAEKIYKQSGLIPYQVNGGRIQVLLITSRGGNKWVIPKGLVEPELSALESARKEGLEEAGIQGWIAPVPVGVYEYEKWNGVCRVQVFAMRVEKMHDSWEEDFRIRQWVSTTDAPGKVDKSGLRRLLEGFMVYISKNGLLDRYE